jgi:23S rRNA pseudouridine1911/1915/1917 synthase
MHEISATAEDSGLRVDVWLERRLPDLSRSRIQTLLRDGHITVDGAPPKAHRKVRAGMVARISIPEPVPVDTVAEDLPLDVVYEDDSVIVINKAAGMVVHPAAGHEAGTLVNALLFHCDGLAGVGGELRPGIVHRLDRNTSGLLVAAKNETALRHLQEQFKDGRVHKEYAVIVRGIPRPPRGRIETQIGRSRTDRKKMSADPASGGRTAISHYEVEEVFAGTSLLRVRIETGRTHQIRVHMSHLGHPVIGDPQYGGRRAAAPVWADRQMLHARRLSFLHPRTGERLSFETSLPADMANLIERLRRSGGG